MLQSCWSSAYDRVHPDFGFGPGLRASSSFCCSRIGETIREGQDCLVFDYITFYPYPGLDRSEATLVPVALTSGVTG